MPKHTKPDYEPSAHERYMTRHKVQKHYFEVKLDPTLSYIVDDKGKRLAKNLVSSNRGYNHEHESLFWEGWYSRLDHVGEVVAKAYANAQKYHDYMIAELAKLVPNDESRRRVYYLRGSHIASARPMLHYFEIWRDYSQYGPYGKEREKQIIYSENDHLTFGPQTSLDGECIKFANIVQYAGWNDIVNGWENGFPEGAHLLHIFNLNRTKWRRYHQAKSTLRRVLTAKLEVLAAQFKPGDLLEFTIAGKTYRYERKDERLGNDYKKWLEVTGKPIQKLDISGILPEDPYHRRVINNDVNSV